MTPPAPRARFAPSPTGYLHVGSAQSALFNWLFTRHEGGTFLLRIEDTDAERNRPELTENILEMLRWLGIDWDGEPVHQSDRLAVYAAAAERLRSEGRAYYCDCTSEQVQERARERGGPPGYDGHCRDRDLRPGEGRALRFRTPDEGSTEFDDVVRGHVSFDNSNLEDFVLLRSNGRPTFFLANVVDDADMAVTHVVRGEDHVNGTPKYVLVRQALGHDDVPVFAHLPLLVNESRKKLSKRRDDVSVADYRDGGYLPEAMRNYLALLGWGPPDGVEVRPIEEIVELFRLEDVNPSPAFFDLRKLQHVNGEHIRALPVEEFVARATPFLSGGEAAVAALWSLAPLVQERVKTLAEVDEHIDFLHLDEAPVDEASWEKAMVRGKAATEILDGAIAALAESEWTADGIHAVLTEVGEANGLKLNKAQAPVRVAVTGRTVGPPLMESLVALGRDRTLARLQAARARL